MIIPKEQRRLWLIDASYLFNAQDTYRHRYKFNYSSLRTKLEEESPIWRAYYLNSIRRVHDEPHQDSFHHWLESAPPQGPKIITQLYGLRTVSFRNAYCFDCRKSVTVTCPNGGAGSKPHNIVREQQKGVDVGIATLALTLFNEYGTLILSSGDSDLTGALDYLITNGKRFELAVFKSGVATELQSRADMVYWIDDFADEVERRE